ncbi:MAG TPA: MarR family transcriptional regulator, partial [Thermomicrobiales bacterium]|nr:MarR family transcriptional regulator [Thermomicrobiales bacterium]
NRTVTEKPLTDQDFQALAAFRAALRQFVRFSEEAAREAGLTPQQHQALVAIRGHIGNEPPTVGELAEALQVKHHSAVGLVDRIVQRGFARREPSTVDNRRVHVVITPAGDEILRSLTSAHREEHRQLADVLRRLTEEYESS